MGRPEKIFTQFSFFKMDLLKKKVSFLEKAQICSPLIRIFQVLPHETSQII